MEKKRYARPESPRCPPLLWRALLLLPYPNHDLRGAGLPLTPGFAERLGLEAADFSERLVVRPVAAAEERAQPEAERAAHGTRTELRIAARLGTAQEERGEGDEGESDV
jgi:hypothetical protein